MSAAEYVKSQGLPSVAYVAQKINEHPQRLFEWYNDNRDKFEVVVAGVKVKFMPNSTLEELCEAKPVAWCDEDGSIISEYESVGQAARFTSVGKSGIARCCKGLAKVAGAARWKYIDSFGVSGNTTNLRYETWLYARKKDKGLLYERENDE